MLLLLAAGFAATAGAAEPFDFGLIGDYPYFPRETPGLPHLIRDLREADLRFVLHLGDLHNPRSATKCSDALYASRLSVMLEADHPFVLTPGDNDWSDCRNEARTPYEHLEGLRRIFYPDPKRTTGPRSLAVQRQSAGDAFPELVENAIWEEQGVVFATLHMVLPSFLPFGNAETEAYKRRLIEAGEAWLDEVFAQASQREARAVFLATQADLWSVTGLPTLFPLLRPDLLEQAPDFARFKAKLADHVRAFRRPVVLANGDSHYFRVDKPLFDAKLEMLETFTRVEGFGSPHGHWVRVRVEPERPEVFSFRQEIVEENVFTLTPPEQRSDAGGDPGLGPIVLIPRVYFAVRPYLAGLGAVTLLALLVKGVRRLRRGR